MNYAADAAHWADHASVDFTDRQRIKRKVARWQRNYRELSAGERMAVLAAILEPEGHRWRPNTPAPAVAVPS
jgi:DNA adenine methylase